MLKWELEPTKLAENKKNKTATEKQENKLDRSPVLQKKEINRQINEKMNEKVNELRNQQQEIEA